MAATGRRPQQKTRNFIGARAMAIRAYLPLLLQISTMLIIFAIGLQSRWSDLGYAIARPRLLLRGFVAVYVAVPATAFVAALLLPMEPAVKIGIVAMGLAPLAPLAPGKMLKAGAGISYVIGVYVGLLMMAAIVVPATLEIVTTISGGDAKIGVRSVTGLVVGTVLVPLLIGVFIGSRLPDAAQRIARIANILGSLMLFATLALILLFAGGRIMSLIGDGTLLAIVLASLAGLATGHMLGGPDTSERIALAEAAAARHPGIAALLVHQNFENQPAMLGAVLLYLLVGVLVSGVYLKWARRRPPEKDAPQTA
jgi:BASS family bile acid:Na+ symporter